MDVFEAIKTRRSIRAFRPDLIPRESIRKILDAARYAPSAGNLQSWEFILVEDISNIIKLCDACLEQQFILRAPLIIVVCTDTDRSAVLYGSRGKYFYSMAEVCAAVQNLMLAAHSLGLGTCWVGAFDEQKVRAYLNLPAAVVPIAIIPVGYPELIPQTPQRASIGDITHFEKYGKFEVVRTGEPESGTPPGTQAGAQASARQDASKEWLEKGEEEKIGEGELGERVKELIGGILGPQDRQREKKKE